MPGRVQLRLTPDDREESQLLEELAGDLAALSDKIEFSLHFWTGEKNTNPRNLSAERTQLDQFAGLPTVTNSLACTGPVDTGDILKLEPTSGSNPRLTRRYNFEVFVSLAARPAQDVVQALN